MNIQSDVHYRSEREVEEVLRRFESCELTASEFGHRPHLTVALLYSLRFSEQEALERMRAGVRRFLEHHRLDSHIYHETLTAFWLRRVRAFVSSASARECSHAVRANELIAACGDSRVVYRYYSKELIDSDGARTAWVEPDLKALDF